MQYQLEGYGKTAEITGFKGIEFAKAEAYLKACRKQPMQTDLQFFEADLIATAEHLYFAAVNALQAFKTKTNISKSLAMETMLYASAQRQIQRSIEVIGVKPQSRNMAVVIIGDSPDVVEAQMERLVQYFGSRPDHSVLALTAEKMSKIRLAFAVTEEEFRSQKSPKEKALLDLVIEHMALLSTQL